jgi:RND superfamily putative drug exporter
VAAFVVTGAFLNDALTNEASATNDPESIQAKELLENRLRGPAPNNEAIIVQSASMTVDDPAFRSLVEGIRADIAALGSDKIVSVDSFYESNSPELVSKDRKSTLIPFTLAGDVDDATENVADVITIVEEANGEEGFAVNSFGFASVSDDFNEALEKDLQRSEMGTLPIALVILVLVFGALLAAFLPVAFAMAAIFVAIALVAIIGQQFRMTFFVTNMIFMMGLAVGIDYCLFIISRFREERGHGRSREDAIGIASSTAGRAVLFSGMTVVIALLGLLIVPQTIFRSLAAGAILVVIVAVLASLTLLPAILSLVGDNINASLRDIARFPLRVRRSDLSTLTRALTAVVSLAFFWFFIPVTVAYGIQLVLTGIYRSIRGAPVPQAAADANARFADSSGGFWDRVARAVMAQPVVSVVAVTVLLVAAAVPYFDIEVGFAGVSTLPDSFQSKEGFEKIQREFSGGEVYPAEVVIDGDVDSPQVQSAIEKLKTAVATDSTFGPSHFEANDAGDLGLLSFQLAADPNATEGTDAIERLRGDYIPQAFAGVNADVLVGGLAAENLDGYDLTSKYLSIVIGFVLALSFILLMMVFRSIVVPAKAIVMNLLSVGAAYGLIVLIFQKGTGNEIFGFQQVEAIEAWLPLFLFSILFGLSMDYHVFLLSRIKEQYDHTRDNTGSVAFGLRSTGRLITGAALIMVAVFGGFALGDLVMFQQMGFGLGVAVLIDATVIRTILVPASMKLLGDWNWYLPPVLSWLPHLGIEGPARQPAQVPSGEIAGGGG